MTRKQNPIAGDWFAAKFAAALREARAKCGRTAEQCAAEAEITYKAWLNYEAGKRLPRLDALPAIGRAVKIPYKRLLP